MIRRCSSMRDVFSSVLVINILFVTFNVYRKHYLNQKVLWTDCILWIITFIVLVLSIEKFPWWIYVLIFGMHLVYFKENFNNIHIRSSVSKNQNIIYDAIHALPYGVLVYEMDKKVHLINHIMIDLGAEIQGGLFSNPKTLWHDIINHPNILDSLVSKTDDEPLIRIKNKVWRFYKLEHIKDDIEYVEIYALDTTLQYQTLLDIEKDTIALKNQRQSLKLLIKNLFETHKQEEVLNYKIKIHNNLGEAILQSKTVIQENKPVENQLEKWELLLNSLNNSFSDHGDKSNYEALRDLIQAGKDIGCRLHIKGNYPYDKTYAYTFYEIIREAMINAKKHADAKNVYVTIERPDHTTKMMIYNDGSLLDTTLDLKGGLKQMKEEVEKNWGTIDFYPQENFTILIRFPY